MDMDELSKRYRAVMALRNASGEAIVVMVS
jgi:hypothetical protein